MMSDVVSEWPIYEGFPYWVLRGLEVRKSPDGKIFAIYDPSVDCHVAMFDADINQQTITTACVQLLSPNDIEKAKYLYSPKRVAEREEKALAAKRKAMAG